MSQSAITPVVLTWNESANIERTLARLGWAEKVLVVDSGSDDGTQEIARRFGNVVVVERPFDDHASQWEFGIRHPEVPTDWVLALDADYVLTTELEAELARLPLGDRGAAGYRARFVYCIDGRPLRASLYPPVIVLFDRRHASYVQQGHTQRLELDGEVRDLSAPIRHDDRKGFERYVEAQGRYAKLEAERLRGAALSKLSWSGRLRKLRIVAPWAVPLWVLFGRGLLLEGGRGLAYARQRFVAEKMIARELWRSPKAGEG